MTRWRRKGVWLVFAVLIAGGPLLAGSDPVGDGRLWLEDHQNGDGSWGSFLPDVVTSTSLETLTSLDVCAAPVASGAGWLSIQGTGNHESLARQIIGLSEAPGFEESARAKALDLLALRNPPEPDGALPNWPEGGWGVSEGFETDNLTTSAALLALDRAGFNGGFEVNSAMVAGGATDLYPWEIPADAVKARILITVAGAEIRLRMAQGAPPTPFDPYFPLLGGPFLIVFPDSGLPFTPGTNYLSIENPNAGAATYTLTVSYETPTFDTRTLAEPLSYLRESQNVDGGWGPQRGQPSELYTTLHALLTLLGYSQYDFATEVTAAVGHVKSLQLGDGSFGFGGSTVPYVTGLAALGLVHAETPSFSVETDDAVAALLALQAGDGSWDQEAYDTGLAMQALWQHALPPTADAGSDQTVTDSDVSCSESVTLSGSADSPDGTITGYAWTEGCIAVAAGSSPAVDLPVGTHRLRLTVTADDGQTAHDTVIVTVNGVPVDLDLDGFLACTADCDDGNSEVHAAPGEARNLLVTGTGDLSWDPPADLGGLVLVYDVLRSADASDFVGSTVCLETDDGADTAAQDTGVPAAGSVFYYLPRAENDCPAGGGSLGSDSGGASRSGRTCS
jgi:hypothetical protein